MSWRWKSGSNWVAYSAAQSAAIEAAYSAGAPTVRLPSADGQAGATHTIDMKAMRQVRNDDPTRYRAVCRDAPDTSRRVDERASGSQPECVDLTDGGTEAKPALAPDGHPPPSTAAATKREAPAYAGEDAKRPRLGNTLRGVQLPAGWGVHDGSLLVREFGAPAPSPSVAVSGRDLQPASPRLSPASPIGGRPRPAEGLTRSDRRRSQAFDFDNCLADTDVHNNAPEAWRLQFPHVPRVLARLHAAGHKV